MTTAEFKQQFDEMVQAAKVVYITTHIRPDDDAIASALVMHAYVTDTLGVKARVIVSGEPTNAWQERDEEGVIEWVPDVLKIAYEADLMIFLDGCEYKRFSDETEGFDLGATKSICIDHHPGEPDKFDLIWQDITAAAAAQLVYELLFDQDELTKSVGEDLMYGILGDTGNFRYVNAEKSRVLTVAREILEQTQVDIQVLAGNMEKINEKDFEIVKELIANMVNVELPGIPGFSYSYLPLAIAEKYSPGKAKSAAGFFLYNFVRKIEGYGWGFVVRPDSDRKFSISFRATPGTVNVRELALKFNGGGHVLAAGGDFEVPEGKEMDAEEVCQEVIRVIEETLK